MRPSRVVIAPAELLGPPTIDPTGVATSLPPSSQALPTRSTTPLLLAVVLALGLAIVLVVKYTGKQGHPVDSSFPIAPAIPGPDRRGSNETASPTPGNPAVSAPALPASANTVVELGPTVAPAPAPVARPTHRPISHGKRDAGAARVGQPFMPDDL